MVTNTFEQTVSRLRHALRACAFVVLLGAAATAQTITDPATVDRSRLLAENGSVEILREPVLLSPLLEQVNRFPFTSRGTPSFRLRFRVSPRPPVPNAAQAAPPAWTIDIVDSDDETRKLWSYSPEPTETEFWSSQIFKTRVTIIISTQSPTLMPRVSYDRVVHFTRDSKDLTPIGRNNLAPIGSQSSDIKSWGKAIAHLTVVRDDNLMSFNCTGFLIAPDLLMTNRHCIQSGSEAKSLSARFDFDTPGAVPRPEAQVGVKELVLSSCDLDFAIVRLKKSAPFFPGDNRQPLLFLAAAQVRPNQSLLVIQHPSGAAKQVSLTDCVLTREQMVGNSSIGTDFGHSCDTNKSSSGSPVQVLDSSASLNGRIIGIHHLGFRLDDAGAQSAEQVNRAVKINLITDYIKKISPALARELNLTP